MILRGEIIYFAVSENDLVVSEIDFAVTVVCPRNSLIHVTLMSVRKRVCNLLRAISGLSW